LWGRVHFLLDIYNCIVPNRRADMMCALELQVGLRLMVETILHGHVNLNLMFIMLIMYPWGLMLKFYSLPFTRYLNVQI